MTSPLTKLLIATDNPGKQREYAVLLGDLPVILTWPSVEQLTVQIEETGATFAENARLKAEAYAKMSRLWTLADDSGLEVDALAGAPGVHSARYAGPEATDQDRYRLLLAQLREVPWEKRTARFRCVIALASPDGYLWFTEGTCEGVIAYEPHGVHGFGYDPVFYLPEMGRTMAELPPEVKNRISHRARAAAAMKKLLIAEIPMKISAG